ncbi:hypothetical protein [Flavilitoribacter nigricans]|nr:hypothetical protein [Flavilitoribacter nigricans]
MLKQAGWIILFSGAAVACSNVTTLIAAGKHYQEYQDYRSLQKVVDMIELGADTALVRDVLGEPIDMGFDYRYTLDSVGPKGCVVGAVFHIDEQGKIDQKWIDEICE